MARARRRIPAASSPAVRATMKANRAKDTTPELVVRSLLREAGFTGYRLHWRTPGGRVDIAFVGRKIAIEVYGCFWHRCPRCAKALPKRNRAFWRAKFHANKERDRRKEERLQSLGWRVFDMWECQTRQDGFRIAPVLVRLLKRRTGVS